MTILWFSIKITKRYTFWKSNENHLNMLLHCLLQRENPWKCVINNLRREQSCRGFQFYNSIKCVPNTLTDIISFSVYMSTHENPLNCKLKQLNNCKLFSIVKWIKPKWVFSLKVTIIISSTYFNEKIPRIVHQIWKCLTQKIVSCKSHWLLLVDIIRTKKTHRSHLYSRNLFAVVTALSKPQNGEYFPAPQALNISPFHRVSTKKCRKIENAICQLEIAGTRWKMLMVLLRTENPFSRLIIDVIASEVRQGSA